MHKKLRQGDRCKSEAILGYRMWFYLNENNNNNNRKKTQKTKIGAGDILKQ